MQSATPLNRCGSRKLVLWRIFYPESLIRTGKLSFMVSGLAGLSSSGGSIIVMLLERIIFAKPWSSRKSRTTRTRLILLESRNWRPWGYQNPSSQTQQVMPEQGKPL
jgi:hypothetical protein